MIDPISTFRCKTCENPVKWSQIKPGGAPLPGVVLDLNYWGVCFSHTLETLSGEWPLSMLRLHSMKWPIGEELELGAANEQVTGPVLALFSFSV